MSGKSKWKIVGLWVLALLPLAVAVAIYGRLPEQIPVQWGFDGAVRYGGKIELLLMTGLSPVILIVLQICPKIDPRKENYRQFRGLYDGMVAGVLAFLLVMDSIVISESFAPGRISVSKVVIIGVGALFAVLGNWMPKVKSNFFLGVRTPWALSDPDVWSRSQRLGGLIFFWGGLALVVSGLLLSEKVSLVLVFAVVAIAVVVPTVCSYRWYNQAKNSRRPPDAQ